MNRFAMVLVATVVSGCAYVEYKYRGALKLGPDQTSGVVYYPPKAYLVVNAPSDAGPCDAKIQWLPDYNNAFEAIPHTGWGTSEVSVTFTDGWILSGTDAKADSKAAETLAAVLGVVKFSWTEQAVGGQPPPTKAGIWDIHLRENLMDGGHTIDAPTLVVDFHKTCT